MTSVIGKQLKKIRVDHDERLLDMANRLGKSSAFVSAIEVGKKTPPQGFEEKIIRAYDLDEGTANDLRRAADAARDEFTIEPASEAVRDTVGMLARKINTLPDQKLQDIQAIVEGNKDHERK